MSLISKMIKSRIVCCTAAVRVVCAAQSRRGKAGPPEIGPTLEFDFAWRWRPGRGSAALAPATDTAAGAGGEKFR
jgi:hypothetical protein